MVRLSCRGFVIVGCLLRKSDYSFEKRVVPFSAIIPLWLRGVIQSWFVDTCEEIILSALSKVAFW